MAQNTTKPIRVMRIISRMNIGGPAVQISGLMRGLNAEEFEHRLYVGFCAANEIDYLDTVATDVRAHRIDGLGRRINLMGDLAALISLVREIRSFKPDVIHTHTAKAGFLGRIASMVSLQTSIRLHTFHGHLLTGYFGKFKRSLVVLAEKFLALFTDELITVGDKVRQDLLRAGIGKEEKFSLMQPGLEIGSIPNKSDSQISFGITNGRLQCAFIGRITQIKRPDRFLDVVAELKNREVELDFLIAGDGELLESCRERITKEVLPIRVLGWQLNIERVLSAADIVVLTSDNEGAPLSLIQAGMAGIPVVTTDVGSVSEIVIDGVTGIVTPKDVQKIADALEKLVKSKDLIAQLGVAAQRYTLANYGTKRLVQEHEELYKRLLSSRAKS